MAEFGISSISGTFIHGSDPETGIDHYKCAKCDPDNRRKVL
jgi:hypothetical protein